MKSISVRPLTTADHSRDSAGMRYVYPVVSRRAGGVSVGINLNPNNACNWHCVYCQVPDLKRGGPPPIDLALLGSELDGFLRRAASADFLRELAPEGARRIVDVAFSGNGEPTSAAEFGAAVEIVARVLAAHGLLETVKIRLITNGSLVDRVRVREALRRLGELGGEAWFKIDAATAAAIARINGTRLSVDALRRRFRLCAALVPTWVQTCVFGWDDAPPAEAELAAYLELLGDLAADAQGVLLYGLARPSCQTEAPRLSRLPPEWLEALAQRIAGQGLVVKTSP